MASRGPPGGLWGPLGVSGVSGAFGRALRRASEGFGGLRGPPGARASRHVRASGLVGLKNPPRGLQGVSKPSRRFGSGFRVFGLPPLTPLADPGIQRFQANLLGWSGRVPSGAPGRTSRSTRLLGLGFLNNIGESRKGRSPRQGHCPSTWRCSSRSTNSLGLHSSYKRWCE